MGNLYANLTRLKSLLGISAVTTYDADLLLMLGVASREIEKFTKRHFYLETATRYFDAARKIDGEVKALIDDLISVTTFKTDEDLDLDYDNTLTEGTDFLLWPYNKYPREIALVHPSGNYGCLGIGPKSIQIAGLWGYGDGLSAAPYSQVTTAAEAILIGDTEFNVTSGAGLSAGDTILCETEQIYIESVATNNLSSVKRGVNGTSAAAHDNGKAINLYRYPDDVTLAALITSMRWWKRKDSAFQDNVGNLETGVINTTKGLDLDVKQLLTPLCKGKLS